MDNAKDQRGDFLGDLIQALNLTNSASDFCQAVIHNILKNRNATSAHLISLSNDSRMNLVGAYGYEAQDAERFGTSVWSESPAAQCIREGKAVFSTYSRSHQASNGTMTSHVVEIPILHMTFPVGCLGVEFHGDNEPKFMNHNVQRALSLVGHAGLNRFSSQITEIDRTLPLRSIKPSQAIRNNLSTRQLTVLEGIAKELTNVQIARLLHLSESSIKQETVKIFRELGVSSRVEARELVLELGSLEPNPLS